MLEVHFNNDDEMQTEMAAAVSRQRGASLIEIILYLGAAAIAIFAVFSLSANAFGGSKGQAEARNLQGIISGVTSLYGTSRDYGTASLVPALIQSKVAPASTVISGNQGALRNSFGGNLTVTGVGGTQYEVTEAGVPERACMDLVQMDIDAISVSSNGTAAAGKTATTNEATAMCSLTQNTITWRHI